MLSQRAVLSRGRDSIGVIQTTVHTNKEVVVKTKKSQSDSICIMNEYHMGGAEKNQPRSCPNLFIININGKIFFPSLSLGTGEMQNTSQVLWRWLYYPDRSFWFFTKRTKCHIVPG